MPISFQDIPIHLTPLVKAVEDKLEALPNDAVFITTTKGAVDKRKTLELRQLIREEEYQLEMYGSNKKGKGRPRAPRKRSREPRIDLSSALIEAAEASAKSDRVGAANPPVETLPLPASSELQTENGAPPKLMMRVRVSNSGFYCEHSRNGSLIATSTSGRGAAENLAIDEEDTPLSDNEDEGGEIRQMPSPRSMKATQLDSQSHGYRVPSNKTAGDLRALASRNNGMILLNRADENPIRIDDDDDEDTQSFHRVPSSRQQLTNQDALNYVSRMRLHHKIDRATISKFVSLLKVRRDIKALNSHLLITGIQDESAFG